MSDYIDDVFGATGALAQKFDGYQPRKGQVELTRGVDASIRDRQHLFAEAPTGTGKSLAYAVPAIYHATHGNTPRVLLVTANIALQEQLVRKDLPLLQEILPWKFNFSLLKGINNYLCLDQLDRTVKKSLKVMPLLGDAKKVAAWAATTTTGDKSELTFEPDGKTWSQFATTSDDCEGDDCKFFEECHAMSAKKTAGAAQIIVTNYHLLFAHFKVQELTDGKVFIIPEFDVAVLDEGHKAADIARDCFDTRITYGMFKWVVDKLFNNSLVNRLMDERDAFFERLASYRKSPKYKIRIREKNCVSTGALYLALDSVANEYERAAMGIKGSKMDERKQNAEIKKIIRRANRARELIANIKAVMNLEGDDVYYIDENKENGYVTLCSKPVNVAKRLNGHLFSEEKSTAVTSATLMAAGSFNFVSSDLGAIKPRTLIAESPFTWGTQALLVLPDVGIPDDPNHPDFAEASARTCAKVVGLARGRTLALFTSNRNMNAAHPHLLKMGYRILKQGDMPRTQLIEEFKKDINSVLMGVDSFWAGVDVPGESLSCVFIDKLPFVNPEDPIANAITERDPEGWFMNYSLPRAIIAFKQGFGRLIRRTTDRGVVVCLDRRITTKRYGQLFINSLPSVMRSTLVEDVRNFLDTGVIIPKSVSTGRSLFDNLRR